MEKIREEELIMKIKEITYEEILFDNGNTITFDHDRDCCEENYADFQQLEELAYDYEFDEELIFEECGEGFRFGDEKVMFFIPCYSCQNGHYTDEVDIYYNGYLECTTEGEHEDKLDKLMKSWLCEEEK